mmetsp:Transcript_28242/g.37689  ORF Transcript_28242/g.37689 Transcript_28242/m.37689 type:complete len:113 (-) Transcript_28242:1708-2046(-)
MQVLSSQETHPLAGPIPMKPVLGPKNYTQKLGRARRTHIIDGTSHVVREETTPANEMNLNVIATTRAGRSPIENLNGTVSNNQQLVSNVNSAAMEYSLINSAARQDPSLMPD